VKTFHKRVLLGVFLSGLALAAQAGQGDPAARISMDEARAIAEKHASGAIKDAEYEKEKGAWRYSFEFKQDGRIHEIGVDANSGEIVEDSWEDKADKD
jgi:uncharacterized membrane protein YkoI